MNFCITLLFSLFLGFAPSLSAQVTIVKGAPDEAFDLGCSTCTMAVRDIALWKGARIVPYNGPRAGLTNLLHWAYYDGILHERVVTPSELPWEKCTQLLDEQPDSALLSLQISLDWVDSMAQSQRLYLFVAGMRKADFENFPLFVECATDEAAAEAMHFAAIAAIAHADGSTETYEAMLGDISLENFDVKTGAISGVFSFTGNCIGWVKRGMFRNGKFSKG